MRTCAGHCKISDVDAALGVVMRMRMELGLFDPPAGQKLLSYSRLDVGTPEASALNLLATQRSLVLIKNGDKLQPVLPLARGKSTAVLGPHHNATWALIQDDTGDTCPSGGVDCIPSPLEMIARYSGASTRGGPS